MLDVRIDGKSYARSAGAGPVLGAMAFAARPGEILALLGPSGTGKTTLIRAVLGLDRDFAGSVACPAGHPGVMFQEPRLLPWLTVAANVALVTPAGSDAAVESTLARVGLAGLAQARPRDLSLGMARRVALARALVNAPRWLVLDEPFASLDPATAGRLADCLADYAEQQQAIILLATHELDQALAIAHRVLVIAGRPATLAADVAVRARPRAAVRAELLGRFGFLDAEAAERAAWRAPLRTTS